MTFTVTNKPERFLEPVSRGARWGGKGLTVLIGHMPVADLAILVSGDSSGSLSAIDIPFHSIQLSSDKIRILSLSSFTSE